MSSLLSHFENISSAKPPLAIPKHNPLLDQERARSSLDLPRRPSPWNTGGDASPTSATDDGVETRRPFARHLPPGAASRQRPLSTGPWSPPHTPPRLTLQSPVSPPKPLFNSPTLRNLQQQIESDDQRQDLSQRLAFPQSLPARPLSRASTASHLDQSNRASPLPAKRAPPPPINRASKPATPTTLGFGFDQARDGSKERLSPFNTPPSSDETLGREDQSHQDNGIFNTRSSQHSYFPPPLPQQSNVSARRSAEPQKPPQSRAGTADTRPKIASVNSHNDTDHPEQRPLLPTRPAVRASPPRQKREDVPPPRPSEASKQGRVPPAPSSFLPPPKRSLIPSGSTEKSTLDGFGLTRSTTEPDNSFIPSLNSQISRSDSHFDTDTAIAAPSTSSFDYPDASQINRRPPKSKCGVHRIWTEYDTKLFDLNGNFVCSGGFITRAWDTKNARLLMDVAPNEREIKVTSMVFKPGRTAEEEGLVIWLGNNVGDIQELDLTSQSVLETKSSAHGRREIVKMHRHQNSIWSLDEEGRLHVWAAGDKGTPSLRSTPMAYRVSRGYTFSIVVKNLLWLVSGRDIRVYSPSAGEQGFNVTLQPLSQPGAGEITSGAVISTQLDKVYFGHSDGKISFYSTKDFICLGILNVSAYKINCLAGVGVHLWAGYNTGMICVYDTRNQPWKILKEWQAHANPVSSFVVDRSSLWKFGHLQVASLGADNAICLWDGMLEEDWLGKLMTVAIRHQYFLLT